MGKDNCPRWCNQYTCKQWQCKTCTEPAQTCQPPPFPPCPPPPHPSRPPSPSPPPPPKPDLPAGICPCALDGERMRALSDPSPAEGGGGDDGGGGGGGGGAGGGGGVGGPDADGVSGDGGFAHLAADRRATASTPEHSCFWDESCPGHGCNAFGFPKCRFCGFELFNRCPVSPPPPASPLPLISPPPPSPPPSPAKPPLENAVEEAHKENSKREPTLDREDDDDERDDDDEGEGEGEVGDEGDEGDEGEVARTSDEILLSDRNSRYYFAGFSTPSDDMGRHWSVSSAPNANSSAAKQARARCVKLRCSRVASVALIRTKHARRRLPRGFSRRKHPARVPIVFTKTRVQDDRFCVQCFWTRISLFALLDACSVVCAFVNVLSRRRLSPPQASLLLSASENGVAAQNLRPATPAVSSFFLSKYVDVASMTLFLAGIVVLVVVVVSKYISAFSRNAVTMLAPPDDSDTTQRLSKKTEVKVKTSSRRGPSESELAPLQQDVETAPPSEKASSRVKPPRKGRRSQNDAL